MNVNLERAIRLRKRMPMPTNCAWWSNSHGPCEQLAAWQNAEGDGLCDHHDYLFFRMWFRDPYGPPVTEIQVNW